MSAETFGALFAGLCTFDIIQGVARMPGPNEKVTALEQTVAAGGPATNAAVTFAFLGGQATLLTGVGRHPLTQGMRADLQDAGVAVIDAASDDRPPAVSSVITVLGSGDRCVVSANAAGRRLEPPPDVDDLVAAAGAVLIDGHHPALALAAARAARSRGRLCILDGGSWKQDTPALLPYVDIAICSADFRPPGSGPRRPPRAGTLEILLDAGVPWAAVTDGSRPVRWASRTARGEVAVPPVTVADTLGAGDIFHGAFTHAIAGQPAVHPESFGMSLRFAAAVAAHSCATFGTRAWMRSWPAPHPAPPAPRPAR
jgi:sugar/nucleoside kinase (ribokinase family)